MCCVQIPPVARCAMNFADPTLQPHESHSKSSSSSQTHPAKPQSQSAGEAAASSAAGTSPEVLLRKFSGSSNSTSHSRETSSTGGSDVAAIADALHRAVSGSNSSVHSAASPASPFTPLSTSSSSPPVFSPSAASPITSPPPTTPSSSVFNFAAPSAAAPPSTSSPSGPSALSSAQAWHLERSRRLRSNRLSIMGNKLHRRESHSSATHGRRSSKEDASSTMQDAAEHSSSPKVQLPHPSPVPMPLDIHSPLQTGRSLTGRSLGSSIDLGSASSSQRSSPASHPCSPGAVVPVASLRHHSSHHSSTSSSLHTRHNSSHSTPSTPVHGSTRPPHHPNHAAAPSSSSAASSSAVHSNHSGSTVPAAVASATYSPHASSSSTHSHSHSHTHHHNHSPSPASPIASASPTARRIKAHLGGGSHNSYALPPDVLLKAAAASGAHTSSPSKSPSDLGPVAPVPLLTLPAPANVSSASASAASTAAAAATHQQHEEQEAILFSPVYVLPSTCDGSASSSSSAVVPPSVNSMQETVAAQSTLVQTAVAVGHVRNAAASTTPTKGSAPQGSAASASAASTAVAPAAPKAGLADAEEFDPFLFIKNLPPLEQAVRTCRIPVLPARSPSAPRIALALDLDETLVHCSVEPLLKSDLTFQVSFNSVNYCVYVKLRPHLYHFLRTVRRWFEVIVFTASQRIYADKLLNILDTDCSLIHHRVFRDSCVCIEGNYLKDLTVLGRPLESMVILDNSVQAFGYQLDNGVPIESWFDDESDEELLKLLPFLDHLRSLQDVRPMLKQTFKLSEFVRSL